MNMPYPLPLILIFVSCTAVFSQAGQKEQPRDGYVCLPCGRDCDQQVYDKPGACAHCGMERVKKSTVSFGSIAPEQLCGYLTAHPGVLLLDVRSRREFEGRSTPDYGTLKNAINIPIQEFDSRIAELNAYKDREIIVYCSHGQRSSQVSYALTQKGFGNVRNLTGGLRVLKDDACKR